MDLKEIVLTKDKGYVIKETYEPVEILGGGANLGRVSKDNTTDIEAGIEDAITRVYVEGLPQGTNGYIFHMAVPLGQVSDKVPAEKREVMVAFSAVKYQKKTK